MAAPSAGYTMFVKIGLAANPTNKMSGVTDINIPLVTAMLDVSNADAGATNGFAQSLPGITSGKGTIKVNYDPSDTNGQAVARAAVISKALVYFIFSLNGTNTVTASGYIDAFTENAPVKGVNNATISVALSGQIAVA